MSIKISINGEKYESNVEPRTLLIDFIREYAGLTGTHRGCSSGRCGACTVLLDGEAVKSCMIFAPQADGKEITTIEGIEAEDGGLHPIQEAFADEFAVQCGFCTPGMILSTSQLLSGNSNPTEEEIKEGICGNICRCTGYVEIINTIKNLGEIEQNEDIDMAITATSHKEN